MSTALKKVIAREGLVMLGIVAAFFVMLGFAKLIHQPKTLTDFDIAGGGFVVSPQDESDAINLILDFRKKYPQYNDKNNLEITERMSSTSADWKKAHEVMQRIDKESIEKYQYNFAKSKPGKINSKVLSGWVSNFANWFLLFSYPIYLLIRFIFWAIRTVKQKE